MARAFPASETSTAAKNSGGPALISLSADNTFKFMLWVVFALALAHASIQFLSHVSTANLTLVELTNLDNEKSLGTLFAVVQWTFATFLLFALMQCRSCGGTKFQWASLASIFAFLTVDEFCSLHEKLSRAIHGTLNTSGLLVYAWVVPYAVMILTMIVMLGGLWMKLPAELRRKFFLAGALFVAGAIGVEMFEGMYADSHGTDLTYALLFVLPEETLEMLGLALFGSTLLSLLAQAKNDRL